MVRNVIFAHLKVIMPFTTCMNSNDLTVLNLVHSRDLDVSAEFKRCARIRPDCCIRGCCSVGGKNGWLRLGSAMIG